MFTPILVGNLFSVKRVSLKPESPHVVVFRGSFDDVTGNERPSDLQPGGGHHHIVFTIGRHDAQVIAEAFGIGGGGDDDERVEHLNYAPPIWPRVGPDWNPWHNDHPNTVNAVDRITEQDAS